MTLTRFTLDDLGGTLSERALWVFCKNIPVTSKLWRSLNPDDQEISRWQDPALLPQLLATAIDEIRAFQWAYAQTNTKKNLSSKFPEQIPRPGIEDKTTRIGKEPIPVAQFKHWYEEGGER